MNPLTFSPPPLSRLQKALFLQKKWFAPEFFGLENVDRASLLCMSAITPYTAL